ncbi:MAG TPA: YtxH domain-containing protein [Phototrophicaceae bacterium]|jgi:gas vesicle protein|nr:YtxH domain-containing protein [Phototrophicaceae bacterium]
MNNDRVYYSHDAESHAMREITRLMALCLMLGLGVGAVLALLVAPTSGKKVRDDLTKTVEQGWNNGRETVEPVVKRLEEEFAELRKQVEERLK